MPSLRGARICFIAGTLGQGGAERQLFYVVRMLARLGAEVRVLCLTEREFWEGRIIAAGVAVTYVGRSKSRLLRLARVAAALRRFRPDVVQSQHFYTNLYSALSARMVGSRDLGAIRSSLRGELGAGGVLMRLSLGLPRLLVANSQAALRSAHGHGVAAKRLRFFPNVVDTDYFRPGSGAGDGVYRVLAVGRLDRAKRFDRFIAVLDQARRLSGQDVRGILVGAGALRSALESQARARGLSAEQLEFRGAVSNMLPVYREADALVLTSDYEGTPNVVLEAMACGLPVIATRVGDVPEIVRHGETGFLVAPSDAEAIAERLVDLLRDRALGGRLGSTARGHAERHYSFADLPAHLEDLYQAALS